MNAERLHALAMFVESEFSSGQVLDNLDTVITQLGLVLEDSNPENQQNLATAIEALYHCFAAIHIEDLSPAWVQMFEEIGGSEFTGPKLSETVQTIFQRNQITPAVAVKELKQLQKRLRAFLGAIDNMIAGFKTLEVGSDELHPGECEVGMVIPRKEVHNRLPDFTAELAELTFVIETFSEVATGKPDDTQIKTISSSDLTVILKASVSVCSVFAKAVEKVMGLYKGLLEIKKIKGEMEKHGMPDTVIAGVEQHANAQMAKGIETISVEVVRENYTVDDEGRRNELITRTKISLSNIAERIDRGFSIEVRAEPLAEGQEDKDNIAVKIQTIQAAAKNLRFIKHGGPPILRLEGSKAKTNEKKLPPGEHPHDSKKS